MELKLLEQVKEEWLKDKEKERRDRQRIQRLNVDDQPKHERLAKHKSSKSGGLVSESLSPSRTFSQDDLQT